MAHDHSHPHAHDHAHEPVVHAGPVLHDPAQESLVLALRHSFNILRLLMIVLVVLYLCSGLFWVEPGQQALVARLGALRTHPTPQGASPVFTQGVHFKLPDPFEKKYTLSGQVQDTMITTFMFNHPEAATAKDLASIIGQSGDLTPGVDGVMFTGDRNLSHGRWQVQYQIGDAALFVQNIGATPRDGDRLLQRLLESAVVQEVAGRTIEQVTRTAREDVRQRVQQRLQQALDDLNTGVRIVQVVADTIEPGAVRPAFIAVVSAENEQQRLEEKAREEATEILSRAAGAMHGKLIELINAYDEAERQGAAAPELAAKLDAIDAQLDEARTQGAGQVSVRLSAAGARADQINETVRREVEQYQRFREQRAAQPGITELSLWVQMREEILSNRLNEIFYVPASNELEIHVKSDPQRKLELEEQAVLKKQQALQSAPPPRPGSR
jgi:modulator of FtsH protease HflK